MSFLWTVHVTHPCPRALLESGSHKFPSLYPPGSLDSTGSLSFCLFLLDLATNMKQGSLLDPHVLGETNLFCFNRDFIMLQLDF